MLSTLSNKISVQHGKHLLFVDDEAGIRETLSLILRRYGFSVVLAATVKEALEEISRRQFDLLICDLNINGEGDGYEVIRAMRAANPHCVAIVLTAFPGVESAIEGIRLGVDDYIIKPANADDLIALLGEKLAARQPKARILSISYDETLLGMRHMILENAEYAVVSVHGLESGLEHCKQGGFDLFVLGHSIPDDDKRKMVEVFRRACPAPIISLRRGASEPMVDGADFHIEPDAEPLLALVAHIVQQKPQQSVTMGEFEKVS
jgi:DNA-binding response OmpR family regulator